MDRKQRTEQKMQELFHAHAAGNEGTDGDFMQILQGYIFGDVCYTGSLDNWMRELVTVTVLTVISALPQLKAHVQASLNAGCTPVEIREAVYQCAPFIGFPRTLNAISTMNEVFSANEITLPLQEQNTLVSDEERYVKGLEIQAPVYGTEIAERYTWLPGEFAQAVKWELIEKNPCIYATVPKHKSKKREIWTAETLMHALEVCDNDRLRLSLNLSFSCSLRIGELLGLTWDCIDISQEAIEENRAYVYVNKELQRVTKEALKELDGKDVLLVFPEKSKINKTVRILKTPKTETSVRKIFLPKSVAVMLQEWKEKQEEAKEVLGNEYQDFNLVMATTFGHPTDGAAIRNDLNKLIREYDLPPVVFHSLRHTSVTYKLKLNGGDIKAVQGDSGHAQVNMVTDVYSHILDDDRKKNAELETVSSFV